MTRIYYFLILILFSPFMKADSQTVPVIRDVTYTDIEMFSVKITWKTNIPADSKVRWMVSDSNYQSV
ncbi:MAG: hypothetical protein L0Y76_11685, partial [Ignavibacteria bacterium]|nr:hypothetical protein [Ignavibacteria bacterium]